MDAGLNKDYENPKYAGSALHNTYTLSAAMHYGDCGLNAVDYHALYNNGYPTPRDGADFKYPRGAGWEQESSTDHDKLVARWTGKGDYPENGDGKPWPYAGVNGPRNVAITVPEGSKLFILDIDGDDGKAWYAEMVAKHGSLPDAPTSISGSGKGFHKIFCGPETIYNTASAIAPGVDIRGGGGCIIAPPSIHPTLGYYRWGEGLAAGEVDIPMAPKWLSTAAMEASKKAQAEAAAEPVTRGRRLRSEGQEPSKVYEPGEATGGTGFAYYLSVMGDHVGSEGFDQPIYKAACSWFSTNGTNADASDLIDTLRDEINGAERDTKKDRSKYDRDDWLTNRIEQARAYIKKKRGEEAEDAGGSESASADDFERVKDWLSGHYKFLGSRICRRVPKEQMKAWSKACTEAEENGKDNPRMPQPVEICGAFDVVGRSSNAEGTEGAGRIISFEGENGKRNEVTLSLAEIRSDPKAVFDILSDKGLWLPVGKNAKINLQMMLNDITPKRWIPSVNTPGWFRDEHGDIVGFMHPSGEFIGCEGAPPVRLPKGSRMTVTKPKGSPEKYTAAIVKSFDYVDTNFYWTLGAATGFVGPLLGIMKEKSCGFGFSGKSSKGNSLGQILGAAATGSPEEGDGLMHGGNVTKNSIEDLCLMRLARFQTRNIWRRCCSPCPVG